MSCDTTSTSHTAHDDATLERAADLLACMAHPVRLAVLVQLHRVGPASVGGLCRQLRVEQSAMSHHLHLLRQHRLVVGERSGKRVIYRLHDDHVGCIVADAVDHACEPRGVSQP